MPVRTTGTSVQRVAEAIEVRIVAWINLKRRKTKEVCISLLSDSNVRCSREFRKVFTKQRTVQALLYAAQWLLFYILILVIVTFNVWLILAVVFGKAIGYFIFIGSPTAERAIAADRTQSFSRPAIHLTSHSAST